MVIHSDTVVAVLKQLMLPEQRQGIGRIVKMEGAWYLQTPNERIPLELPPKGIVHEGESVRYTVNNNTVSLTPLVAEYRHISTVQGDVFMPSAAAPAPVSHSSLPAVFPVTGIPEGLHLFTSAEEALSFVGQEGDSELRDRILQLLADDGIVAVKVEPIDEEVSRALLLPRAEISLSLAALQVSFGSAALASIPIDVWQHVLFDRADLPFAQLRELDLLLQGRGTPFPPLRAGSASAQHNALVQWLHAITAIDRPGADLASCAPSTSATTMISDLEDILPMVSRSVGTTISSPGTFALNGSPLFSASVSPEMIPEAIERLGFTLEHSLVSTASQQQPAFEQTLKSMLLHLAMLLGSNNVDAGFAAAPEAKTQQSPTTSQTPRLPSESPNVNIPDSTRLADRLTGLRREMAATLNRESPHLASRLFDRSAAARLQSDTMPRPETTSAITVTHDAGQSTLGAPAAILKTIINYIRDTAALLSEYVLSTEATIPGSRPLFTEQHTRIAAARAVLLSIAEKITVMLDEVAAAAKPPLENRAALSDNAPVTQQPPLHSLLPLLRSLFDTIDSIIRFFDKEAVECRTADEMRSGMTMNERERAIIRQSLRESGDNRSATMLSQTTLGRTLSTVIDRFESLQLLARQVPTTQGTQQIIALPIKFGDTWAEINVRLLRRHPQRRSKKTSTRFSVDIDVAPPALGALHAHLDYRRSRQLHLSIEFERKASREWFRQHHDELRRTLYAAGFAAVRLDFTSIRPAGDRSVHQDLRKDSGIIDLTI